MHLRKLPSGNWRVIVKHHGKSRSATRSTRSAAEEEGARMRLRMGGPATPEAITVAQLLDQHLEAQPIARSTRDSYSRARRLYLPVAFEQRLAAEVTTPVVDGLYRDLERAEVSVHQIRKINSLLSGAFSRAVRLGLMVVHPCRDAYVPAEPEPDVYTPTTEEAKILLAACDTLSPAFGTYCRVAANTGARPGEVLGLQRRDLHLADDGGTVRFERGIARAGGEWYESRLKTGKRGVRTVAIPAGLTLRLRQHLLDQDLDAFSVGGAPEPQTWLFTEDQARPWHPSTPAHWWIKARRSVGIEAVLYSLRHYVATEIYAAGFDEQTAARRLGHKNPHMSSQRYATSRPARDRAAAEHLEELLGE